MAKQLHDANLVEITVAGVRLREPTDDDLVEIENETPEFRAERLAHLRKNVERQNHLLDNLDKRAARRALRKGKRK